MALRDHWNNSAREARLKMEEQAKRGEDELAFQRRIKENSDKPEDTKFVQQYRIRGKLYDKIKVSLRTMDIIIYVVVALLVITLIVGIVIGN